jgi:hypothetical protein
MGSSVLRRIKAARDRGLPDREAIVAGIGATGRLVSAAAVPLPVALAAFATSQIVFIKEVGVGAVVAVLVDALVVRALLVPSLIRLLGGWNWSSPRFRRRLHARVGIEGARATARRSPEAASRGQPAGPPGLVPPGGPLAACFQALFVGVQPPLKCGGRDADRARRRPDLNTPSGSRPTLVLDVTRKGDTT